MRDFDSQWEHIRSKGKFRFVLVQGLLCWGFPMSLVMIAYLHLFKEQPLDLTLKLTLPVFLIGGILFGIIVWFFLERRYKQHH